MTDRELDLDMDLVREAMEARMVRASERRRATAWDEPPGYYDDDETIANAAFQVTRDTDIGFDAACDICRTVAADATNDGIAFDATMLADVVIDGA